MGLTSAYAEALFPTPVRILGRLLQPYCIGHALLLHRLGNAYVIPDAQVGGGDLLQGIWVCSRSWKQAASGIHTTRVQHLLRFWGWQVRRFCTLSDRFRAEEAFQSYLAQSSAGPSFWEHLDVQKSDRKRAGAPFLLALAARLKGYFACSTEATLSWGVSTALYDCAAWAEAIGHAEIVGDDHLDAIDSMED